MKYTNDVETAMANAPYFEIDGLTFIRESLSDTVLLGIPPDADHNYPVVYPAREQLDQPSNSLYVESERQVKKVVAAYRQLGGSVYDLDGELYRQRMQLSAIQQLGGSALRSVSFFMNERVGMADCVLDVAPYDWETTKLGVAVQKMYPRLPSIESKEIVRQLGYGSRAQVMYFAVEQGLMVQGGTTRRGAVSGFISRALSRLPGGR